MNIQELMGRFVPLNELAAEQLAMVAEGAESIRFAEGETVFDFGDTSPYSYYLVEGRLSLHTPDGKERAMAANEAQAVYPVGNLIPRRLRASVASESVRLLRIQRGRLEKELAREGFTGMSSGMSVEEVKALSAGEREWRLALLKTRLFSMLPLDNARTLLGALKQRRFKQGEVVIREDEPGNWFYVILEGVCTVTHKAGRRVIELNRIGPMDAFGEGSLITGRPRTATVTMATDGTLLLLNRNRFIELMLKPLVHHIPLEAGRKLARSGRARIIDVRGEQAFARSHLQEARNIPMYLLFLKSRSLNTRRHYLVHGDSDEAGQAAAFLLARRGLRVSVLSGIGRDANPSLAQALVLPGAAGSAHGET